MPHTVSWKTVSFYFHLIASQSLNRDSIQYIMTLKKF